MAEDDPEQALQDLAEQRESPIHRLEKIQEQELLGWSNTPESSSKRQMIGERIIVVKIDVDERFSAEEQQEDESDSPEDGRAMARYIGPHRTKTPHGAGDDTTKGRPR
jgi:hypothetical protein